MRFVWLLFGLLFFIGVASAASYNIVSIPYCYNVSVNYRFAGQNYSSLSFPGCSQVDGNDWFCDCHNVVGVFNVSVNTPGTIPMSTNEGLYQLDINYYSYQLEHYSTHQSLFNYGSTAQSFGDIVDVGPILACENTPSVVYVQNVSYIPVNNTVYVDRIVQGNCTPEIVNYTVYVYRNITLNDTTKLSTSSGWDWTIVYVIIWTIVLVSVISVFGRVFLK